MGTDEIFARFWQIFTSISLSVSAEPPIQPPRCGGRFLILQLLRRTSLCRPGSSKAVEREASVNSERNALLTTDESQNHPMGILIQSAFFRSASPWFALKFCSPGFRSFNVGSLPSPLGQIASTDHSQWFMTEILAHEPALRAYLRGRFPGLVDVDDLIQETYARLLRAKVAGKLQDVRPYLFVTARNAALDLARHARVAATDSIGNIEQLSVVEDRPDAAETVSYDQEIEILHEAIAALPPRCREVLILRRFHGLSHERIARQLNISVNTVDAQLCLAVFRCRQFLLLRGVSRDCLASVPKTSRA